MTERGQEDVLNLYLIQESCDGRHSDSLFGVMERMPEAPG